MKEKLLPSLLFHFLMFLLLANECSSKRKGLNWYNPHLSAKRYSGILRANSNIVDISPPLTAFDKDSPQLFGLICEYRLYQLDHIDSEIPFLVSVLNKRTGGADVILKDGYNVSAECSNDLTYNYLISAVDCGIEDVLGNVAEQRNSRKSRLSISIEDVNSYDPYFPTTRYILEVEGGVASKQPLLSLTALDDDCSQRFKSICRYKVLGESSSLFEVTNQGTLVSNHQINSFTEAIRINISIIAYDCGERSSTPAYVRITIKPLCHPGWLDTHKDVEFVSGMHSVVPVFPKISLNTCIPSRNIMTVQLTLTMDVSEDDSVMGCGSGGGITMKETMKLCGSTDDRFVQLLPSYKQLETLKMKAAANTVQLPTLNAYEDERHRVVRIYNFNGLDQVLKIDDEVTVWQLNKLNLSAAFSISFRFFLNSNTTRHKETVLCKSDGSGLSRHHFSIYIQNCHLMLLMRNEHGSKGQLRAAEWHWKINDGKDCDRIWYRVLINVNSPNVVLFLNNELQTPFLIADDYPLREIVGSPQWSVGAAWEGRHSEFTQYFGGKLADLVVYTAALQNVDILKCVDQCKEGMFVLGNDSGVVEYTTDKEFSLQMHSEGNNVTGLLEKMRSLVYFNTKTFPTSGQRRLTLETRVVCSPTAAKCPYVPDYVMHVVVLPQPDPKITITGSGYAVASVASITNGNFYPFDDITITSEAAPFSSEREIESSSLGDLGSCEVLIMSNQKHGKLRFPASVLLRENQLQIEKGRGKLSIRGIGKMTSYQKILRGLLYSHQHVKVTSVVRFLFWCQDISDRYYSNNYTMEVKILSRDEEIPAIYPLIPSLDGAHPAPAALRASDSPSASDLPDADFAPMDYVFMRGKRTGKETTDVTALIIGICIALMAIIVIAIVLHLRLRGCPGDDEEEIDEEELVEERGGERKQVEMGEEEIVWDAAEMTTTVNPTKVDQEVCKDVDFPNVDENETSFSCDRETRQSSDHEARDQSCDRNYVSCNVSREEDVCS